MKLSWTFIAVMVLSVAPTGGQGLFSGPSTKGQSEITDEPLPPMTKDEAIVYWKTLDTVVTIEDMTGTTGDGNFWRGGEFPTGHRLDYFLSNAGWAGKIFIGSETVHPLVFYMPFRLGVYYIDPIRVPRWLTFLPNNPYFLRIIALIIAPFQATKKPGADVKLLEFLGEDPMAAMAYKDTPAIDYFKWIQNDGNGKKLLGLMDDKREDDFWFFTLTLDENGP
jgi:hypothetical protein